MNVSEYVKLLSEIVVELGKHDLALDAITRYNVALALLAEIAKDQRMREIAQREGRGPAEKREHDWRDEPATDAQLNRLLDFGVKPLPGMKKGEASAMIARLTIKK